MPTPPPHHVSTLAFRISGLFRISSLGFRISPDPSGRIMRNEPNPIPRASRRLSQHQNAKRTQSPNANRQRIRNEPNLPHRHPPIDPNMRNEPNSRIPSVPHPPKNTKRTQFATRPYPQKRKTNPIRVPTASRHLLFQRNEPNPSRGGPKSRDLFNHHRRRRFQTSNFRPHPQICKTNPISVRARHAVPPLCKTNPK